MSSGSPICQSQGGLSRSNTFTRMNVSPKCFGSSQYIHKEEHERECRRWQVKLDEVEEKLAEATVNNSDMLQIKAELNKKIVEFEKNQRPLIEQNKRLNDRNRIIQLDLKKVEERLCYAQDDFLTLKDAYDRLCKENNSLKEQRAFPEKVKELDRYRNQVLEYSKCINALRQSGIEKDKRYDLLVLKFKKMKKCLAKRSDDDDRSSSIGSEGSAESSINLDTITEDIDEALEIDHNSFCYDHEAVLKLNALAFGEDQMLKDQLEVANATIVELQAALTSCENMSRAHEECFAATKTQNDKLHSLLNMCNSLKIKLANSEEQNDLLEFQILELREISQSAPKTTTEEKCIETDIYLSDSEVENIFEDIMAFVKMDPSTIEQVKNELQKLRLLACLKNNERDAIQKTLQYIKNLENKTSLLETELNMATCEARRIEKRGVDERNELAQQLANAEAQTSKKKKELKLELESMRKEIEKMSKIDQENQKTITNADTCIKDLKNKLHQTENSVAAEIKEVAQLKAEIINADEKSRVQQKKQEELMAVIDSVTEKLTFITNENLKLETAFKNLQNNTEDKERLLIAENEALQMAISNQKEKYEVQIKNSYDEMMNLKKDNDEIIQEMKKAKLDWQRREEMLKKDKDESNTKMANESSLAVAAIKQCIVENEKKIAQLENEKAKKEQALAEALQEISSLKAQIRPIGTQLERRFEETRFRLQEANKLNEKYEKMLKEKNLPNKEADNSTDAIKGYIDEIRQLKIYNQELEDQFNSQMELISALKKKFLLLNTETGENRTKLAAKPTSSIEDEQYHSEGSSSIGSYKIVRNNA